MLLPSFGPIALTSEERCPEGTQLAATEGSNVQFLGRDRHGNVFLYSERRSTNQAMNTVGRFLGHLERFIRVARRLNYYHVIQLN